MERHRLYLPSGYRENRPEELGDRGDEGYWSDPDENRRRRARRYQDAVYRFAARLPHPRGSVVLDVGCGTGQNLFRHFHRSPARVVGVDQPDAIAAARADYPGIEWRAEDLREDTVWASLSELRPRLVICADVIEHVDDPIELLQRLHGILAPQGRLVLSTPDRDRVEDQPFHGPPRNRHHVREWTCAEMRPMLEDQGFVVESSRHVLPRPFGANVLDAKIIAWRALHLRPIPARRSCMVFELTAGRGQPST